MTRRDKGDKGNLRLRELPPGERHAFCRRVLASLSDLVEGEAPEELCRRLEEILGECIPYRVYRDTFAATLTLTRGLGRAGAPRGFPEERFRRCVEKARHALLSDGADETRD